MSRHKAEDATVAIMNGDVVLATIRFKNGSWSLHPSSRPSRLVGDETEIWAIVEALVCFKV